MEIWRDIEGYDGYQVSNQGNVRGVDRLSISGKRVRGVIRKQILNKNGYLYVNLRANNKPKNLAVHRLVASAFVENPNGCNTVNHINENKTDNRACNLEWMTLQDNLRYGTHTERATKNKPDMTGQKHFNYGKRGSESHTHKGPVIGISKTDQNTTVKFDTAATAARALNLSSGQLCDAINGKAKSCGGYYWRRINE